MDTPWESEEEGKKKQTIEEDDEEDDGEEDHPETFNLGDSCASNKVTLFRLLDHSWKTVHECMGEAPQRLSQLEVYPAELDSMKAVCDQHCGAYSDMISQISDDQFKWSGAISVIKLVDQWRDDLVQRLAVIRCDGGLSANSSEATCHATLEASIAWQAADDVLRDCTCRMASDASCMMVLLLV